MWRSALWVEERLAAQLRRSGSAWRILIHQTGTCETYCSDFSSRRLFLEERLQFFLAQWILKGTADEPASFLGWRGVNYVPFCALGLGDQQPR
jgi:hypothetical protein